MKAKLIKTGDSFLLKDVNDETLAITSGTIQGRMLSLKNCQAIERGYDLDELAMEACNCEANECDIRDEFKKGFQKALELMSDKKFSERDLDKAIEWGITNGRKGKVTHYNIDEFIQSLQQTEWDVEIEMIGPLVYPANLPKEGEERPAYRPKIDADGCLILKRI